MDRDGRVPIMWLGLDRHILTFPVKRGEQVNVVGFVREWVSPVLLDPCRTGFYPLAPGGTKFNGYAIPEGILSEPLQRESAGLS